MKYFNLQNSLKELVLYIHETILLSVRVLGKYCWLVWVFQLSESLTFRFRFANKRIEVIFRTVKCFRN